MRHGLKFLELKIVRIIFKDLQVADYNGRLTARCSFHLLPFWKNIDFWTYLGRDWEAFVGEKVYFTNFHEILADKSSPIKPTCREWRRGRSSERYLRRRGPVWCALARRCWTLVHLENARNARLVAGFRRSKLWTLKDSAWIIQVLSQLSEIVDRCLTCLQCKCRIPKECGGCWVSVKFSRRSKGFQLLSQLPEIFDSR